MALRYVLSDYAMTSPDSLSAAFLKSFSAMWRVLTKSGLA